MSVMILDIQSFANACRTLKKLSSSRTIDACDIASLLSVEPAKDVEKEIDRFVLDCIFFNTEAYRLRYNTGEKTERVSSRAWNEWKDHGEVTTSPQLFLTLRCIDYNSDVTDYMTKDEEERYEHIKEFREYNKKLDMLTNGLARCIANKAAEDEGCRWG